MNKINTALDMIRSSGMQTNQFKQALQMIGRIKPHQDIEFMCAAIGGKFFDDQQKAQTAFEGFKLILSNYSRPDFVIKDYKFLTTAF